MKIIAKWKTYLLVSILQCFSGGEILMAYLGKIAILKCFFFILLPRFFVGALADWGQAICRHYFSASAFLHWLIQFIFHTASFLWCVIIYIFLLISVGQRVVLNSVDIYVKRAPEVFLQHMRMRHEWWNICLTVVTHMHILCKHIFASPERKFITFISPLGDTILIRIYTDARVF